MKYLSAVLLLVATAQAENVAPCMAFDWPMTRELEMMEYAPGSAMESGRKMLIWPEGAQRLELVPGGEASLPVPPGKAPGPQTASGYMSFAAPEVAGTYQVSLSGKAWIDVVQDGKIVPSKAHTMDPSCPSIHKSVRFDLAVAPVTLQISGADATSIVFTIMPAAD
jgi:hypothetical protein